MLSDEEKKEYIEHEILDRLYCLEENDFDKNKVDDGYIKAVLNACKEAKNLIEKQSKEIEELKNSDLTTVYLNGFYDGEKKVKDKIKAKIEELEQWELYNMKIPKLSTLDERLGTKIGIKYVLQSLLEKE